MLIKHVRFLLVQCANKLTIWRYLLTGTVDQYEIGDMSGKYGNIGSNTALSAVYTDYNMPLFGLNSVLFRSVVIHYNNGSRWVCSNVNPKDPTFLFKAKSSFTGTEFGGQITVVSILLSIVALLN